MKTLTATLIKDVGMQRFYKLNHTLTKGFGWNKTIDIPENLAVSKEKDFKPEYKHFCPLNGADIICISDATTHLERLVFVGLVYNDNELGRTRVQIDGAHTMMIHGGDKRSMKPDSVYLRRLASLNGLSFHHSNIITSNVHISDH